MFFYEKKGNIMTPLASSEDIYTYIERVLYENYNCLREHENGRPCIKSHAILYFTGKNHI